MKKQPWILFLAGIVAMTLAVLVGCDLEDDETTYTVYTATTTISNYNAKLGGSSSDSILDEKTYIYYFKNDSYATNSALVKSSFTSWQTQSWTEDQIRNHLSGLGINSAQIDAFMNDTVYGFAVGQSDGSAYLFFRFSGTTNTSYPPATVTSVTTTQVAGKTSSVNVAGTTYQLVFASTGTSGTVKKSGSAVGTFTYDGTTIYTTTDDLGSAYLRNVNGKYYILNENRLKNTSGSGIVGKWVWENGKPDGMHEYYLYFANGVFQNPYFESIGYTGKTWKASAGLITLYNSDGTVAEEQDGIPSVAVYDGTYIYPLCYLLTLN